MSFTLTGTYGKPAALTGILNKIDSATTAGYCQFEVVTSNANLAKISFASTSGAVSGGTLTITTTPALSNTDTTAGTIHHLSVYNGADSKIGEFSCQTGAGSNVCQVSSLTLGAGETITISSFTITSTGS